MIPATFDYVRARSVDEALDLLAEHGDEAKLLAGGHSLLPMMKLRLATPAVLIDVAGIPELAGARIDGDEVVIGAATRHADLESSDVVRAEVPLLAKAASLVGDPQIRNRGTIGGSLAHGDPAADLPTAVLASGGSVVVRGRSGLRAVPVDEFFTGFFETVVADDEMVVEIRVPRRAGQGWGYEKFSRRANDWAIVAVAAVDGRVALANMAPTPVRAAATEAALAAGGPVADAAAYAADGTEPTSDIHADRDFRQHLARVLTKRALASALPGG
jgi:aerobic carbon-monoxide dehydrogenase medium subunit